MILFVDTSIWSLAFRRDGDGDDPRVATLRDALVERGTVVTTGLVIQEVLQGVTGPKHRSALLRSLRYLPVLAPSVDDHVGAADVRNRCRRGGVQVGTIDALLISLCQGHGLTMLTADRDFEHAARIVPLSIWSPAGG